MIKKDELLGYPKYFIYQDDNLYKFNLDSLLLAYFTNLKKSIKTIIDLGAGNGAISLYLTLKTNAIITAVEIQRPLYELMVKSIDENKLNKQIMPICEDILKLKSSFKQHSFDVVVSNPPFFKITEFSNINKNKSLNVARHEVKITLKEIIEISNYLLKDKGSLNLIQRPERLVEVMMILKENKLEPKRLWFVYSKKGEAAQHILIEAVKAGKSNSLEILEPNYIYDQDGSWSEDSLKIFNFKEEV